MNAYKNASFVGIVIFIFGIIIAIYGFSFLSEDNDLEENGIIVKGTVIDINKKAIYRSPFVEFKTKEGQTITFLSKLEVNVDLFNYQIGQEVEGVQSAAATWELSRKLDVAMPITEQVYNVLYRDLPALKAVQNLLHRDPKHE